MDTRPPPSADRLARRLLWLRLVVLVVALATVAVAMLTVGADGIRSWIDAVAEAGWPGVVAFIALYALATVLLVPGTASTVTAGLVYGAVGGGLVAIAGATIGATVAYAIARTVGRHPVEVLFADRVGDIEAWVAERQFRSVMVLRLLPIVPFNAFNYAAGLSPIGPAPYVAGTALGIAPGAFLIAALGATATDPTGPAFLTAMTLLVVMLVGSSALARRWRRRTG